MTTYAYGGDPTGLSGKYHYGSGALGIRGDAVPLTGFNGGGYMASSLSSPTDDANEFYGVIGTIPAGLVLDADEKSAISASGPNGSYVVPWTLYRFGSSLGATTFTVVIAAQLAAAASLLGMVAGTGGISVTPPVAGTVNLAVASSVFGMTGSTGAVSVTPNPGTENLVGSSSSFGMIGGVGAISVTPPVGGTVNLGGSSSSFGIVGAVVPVTVTHNLTLALAAGSFGLQAGVGSVGVIVGVVIPAVRTVTFDGGTNRATFDGGTNRVTFTF